MKVKLSDKHLQRLDRERRNGSSRVEIHDTASDVVIRVGPRAMTWTVPYRVKGKLRWKTVGRYPRLSLKDARILAGSVKSDAEGGVDIKLIEAKQVAEEAERVAWTFNRVADEFLAAKKPIFSAVNYHNTVARLKLARAQFGDRPIDDVAKRDVVRLIRGIEGWAAANRTFTDLQSLFNWSVGRGYLEHSPMMGLTKPHAERRRETFLDPDELAIVWRSASAASYPVGPWVQMIVATGGQRRIDVATMRWKDIDLEAAVWHNVDPSKSDKRVHDVPLNRHALAVLEAVPRFLDAEYVFSGTRGNRPFSGYSKGLARLNDTTTMAGLETRWSPHVIRHTFHTLTTEHLDVLPDEVAMVQGRTSGYLRGAERVYSHARFTKRKRRVLDEWADYLDKILCPTVTPVSDTLV